MNHSNEHSNGLSVVSTNEEQVPFTAYADYEAVVVVPPHYVDANTQETARVSTHPSAPVPRNVILERQDPAHTTAEFLTDLGRATRRQA